MSEKMDWLSVLQVIFVYVIITWIHILVCFQDCYKKNYRKKSERTSISKGGSIISKYDYNVSTYNLAVSTI